MPNAARPSAQTYTITELAAEFDITARAIRFYEDVGLLQPARAGRRARRGASREVMRPGTGPFERTESRLHIK